MALSDPSRLLSNTLWNGIGRGVTILIALFLTPYIISRVGEAGFGLWALANLLVGYLSLADLGIQSSLVRQIAYAQPDRNPKQFRQIVSTSLFFYLGLFVLLGPAGWLVGARAPFLFEVPPELLADARFVLRFVLATIFLSIALTVFSTILPAVQRMDRANYILIATSFLNLGATVFVLESGWGVPGLVMASLAVKAVAAAVQFGMAKLLMPHFSLSLRDFRWDVWRELFSFGWKVQVSRVTEILTFSFDRFFLSLFGGVALLGRYQPAVQVATQARLAPHILVSAALPYASELSSREDRRALLGLYFRGTLYLTFVSFGLLGFVLGAAPLLVTAWLGPGYDDVALWIRIFCVGFLLNAPLSLGGLISQAIGRPGLQARSAILGAALNAVLSPAGFFLAGVTGLTAGATAAVAAASVWFFVKLNAALRVPTLDVMRQCFLKPALHLLLPAAGLWAAVEGLYQSGLSVTTALAGLAAAGAAYAGFALFGAGRLQLWQVRRHLAEAAPSDLAEAAPPEVS